MEEYPRTMQEFEEKFASEQSCIDYLFRLRWPDGFRCPRCGHERFWGMNRGLFRCTSCGLQTSITAGTIFQDTRKPLKLWFQAMWYITNQKHGVSALGLQCVLGFGSYRTSWIWLHKLRCAMIRRGRDRLGGAVEVDETYIGGSKPGKRGRGAAGKVLVLVAAQEDENRIGRIRLCIPLKPATHSGRRRPPNPEQSGRAFRRNPATFSSEAMLPLITLPSYRDHLFLHTIFASILLSS